MIQVVDHGFVLHGEKKCPFYVMPLYRSTLDKLMRNGIPVDKALPYFSQLLDGVEAAHLTNVSHRDLKPANVLHDPDTDSLVVSDFGVASFIPESMFTTVETGPHERLPNMQYAAPEQRIPGTSANHRADIYALGLILNEMFTGQVPHGAGFKRIGETAPNYAYLDVIVERMRQHLPEKRFNSIDEMKLELIAQKAAFVSRQRLDTLRHTVVPSTTVTHPLIQNPPKVIDRDVQENLLIMLLDQPVPAEWIKVFRELPIHNAINNSWPAHWRFDPSGGRSRAMVTLPDHYLAPTSAQSIIDNFKGYVESTNTKFRQKLEFDAMQKEDARRRDLQKQIIAEERRQRILGPLKV